MQSLKIVVSLIPAMLITLAPMASNRAHADEPMIGHMVFFKLNEPTAENKAKLVAACDTYLTKHPGTVYYSAGVRGESFDREVNAKDWDVALHLVFANQAAHDKYQDDERHQKFIAENKHLWGAVKVYDSLIQKGSGGNIAPTK